MDYNTLFVILTQSALALGWLFKMHGRVTAQDDKIKENTARIESLSDLPGRVAAQEDRLRAAEARIDNTSETLGRILSELTRLTTLIEERTSRRRDV